MKIFWIVMSALGAVFWFSAAAGFVTVSPFGLTLVFIVCGLACVAEALRTYLERPLA